jgi:hypothetical protein
VALFQWHKLISNPKFEIRRPKEIRNPKSYGEVVGLGLHFPSLAVSMQKTCNAKTQRRQGATIFNILLQFLDVTIWLVSVLGANFGIFHARFAPLRLCVKF